MYSEKLIALHRSGIGENAVSGQEERDFLLKKTDLEELFKSWQQKFYAKYDKVASFIGYLKVEKLLERSFKAYASKAED